jgi:hypothetical protein
MTQKRILQHFCVTFAELALDFSVVTGLPVLQAPYAGARVCGAASELSAV